MEEIKGIISAFIKVPAGQIGPDTPIGRSALQSSIVLHRMYARLAEKGFGVSNYGNLNYFSELTAVLSGNGQAVSVETAVSRPQGSARPASAGAVTGMGGVGVDLE